MVSVARNTKADYHAALRVLAMGRGRYAMRYGGTPCSLLH